MPTHHDQQFIWVAPGEGVCGEGTYGNPFHSVSKAVECAQPGQTVVLKAGSYRGDVTIQKSGLIDKPLRIVAEKGALVACKESCWYLYDVSDLILSRIAFHNAPSMALSVIGKCERNRFEFLSFVDCGTTQKNSCTFFLGGSGQACTIVDSCSFERSLGDNASDLPVGILLSEGDYQEGEANRDCIITKNRFVNYGYGILVGSQDSTTGEYGHRVTFNTIERCFAEGIMVKCGDTEIVGNLVQNCPRNSISIMAGKSSTVKENRIIDCGSGVRVAGKGHTITGNCIVRCKSSALNVVKNISPDAVATANILIEHNTCVNWGDNVPAKENETAGVLIEPETSCIVRKNLFHGSGKPVIISGIQEKSDVKKLHNKICLISDNIGTGGCEAVTGVLPADIAFAAFPQDDFDNTSGYGANGWMCKPGLISLGEEPQEGNFTAIDEPLRENEEDEETVLPDEFSEDFDEGEYEDGETVFRSFFMHDDEDRTVSRNPNDNASDEEIEEF
jgi:hypothetical protein